MFSSPQLSKTVFHEQYYIFFFFYVFLSQLTEKWGSPREGFTTPLIPTHLYLFTGSKRSVTSLLPARPGRSVWERELQGNHTACFTANREDRRTQLLQNRPTVLWGLQTCTCTHAGYTQNNHPCIHAGG